MKLFTIQKFWTKISCLFAVVFFLIAFSNFSADSQVVFTQSGNPILFDGSLENLKPVASPSISLVQPAQGTGFNNWVTNTALPQTLSSHRVVARNSIASFTVYCVGGNNGTNDVANVYRTVSIATGNDIWLPMASLPIPLRDAGVVIGTNAIYVFGGTSNGVPSNQIFYSIFDAEQITSWQTSSVTLPVALWGHTATFINGYIYLTGGASTVSASSASSIMYVVSLDADNAVAGVTINALPQAKNGHTAVAYDGNLILMGGYNNLGAKSNAVLYASFDTDGSVIQWNTLSSLPVALSNHSSTCYNGLLTVVSGEKIEAGLPVLSNKTYYTSLANFPTLVWNEMSSTLYDFTKNSQSFASDGILVNMGGENYSGTPIINSRYSTVNLSSAYVKKSIFVSLPFYQLGDVRYIQSLGYDVGVYGDYSMQYRIAGVDKLWSDWTHGNTNPAIINQNGKYVQYLISFDGTGVNSSQFSSATLTIQGTQLSGNLNALDTLYKANSPYWATSNISFTSGTHYVEAGVKIVFSPNTGLTIGQANMIFDGEFEDRIILTSFAEAAGEWNGVYFTDASDNGVSTVMNYTIIEKAGFGDNNANLRCDATQEPYLNNCIIRDAVGHGIRLNNSSINLNNCLVSGNTESGMHLTNSNPGLMTTTIEENGFAGINYSSDASVPNFFNCTIQDNLYALYYSIPTVNITSINGTVSLFDNTYNGVVIPGGNITENKNWNIPEYTIFVLNDLVLYGPYTVPMRLTIEPGNTILFAEGKQLKSSNSSVYTGEVYAVGTPGAKITFSSINDLPGGWNGISLTEYSNHYGAYSTFSHCIIENALVANVYIKSTIHTMNHTTIQNSSGKGILCHDASPVLENILFANNADYGLYYSGASYVHNIDDLSFSGNLLDAIVSDAGQISENRTWKNVGAEYVFLGDVSIRGPYQGKPRLTVEKGVHVKFAFGKMIMVGASSPYGGELWVQGSQDSMVVFSSLNGNPGGWFGIWFLDGSDEWGSVSKMEYCVVENAEAYNIKCSFTNQPTISNSIIQNSNNRGIFCDTDAYPTLDNLQIINNQGYGLYFSRTMDIRETMSNLNIQGNSTDALVCAGGNTEANRTWKYIGADYVFLDDVIIRGSYQDKVRLTVEKGVQVKFAEGKMLKVGASSSYGGELWVQASPDSMVVFSSLNGNPGGWSGIYFNDGSDEWGSVSKMEYCMVENGNQYNVYCYYTNQPELSNSIIQNSNDIGIHCHLSSPILTNLQFINNQSYGLFIYNTHSILENMSNLNFSGNSIDGVVCEAVGSINEDRTWKYPGADYVFLNNVTVSGPYQGKSRLTIEKGVTLKFAEGKGLSVGTQSQQVGELVVNGTKDSLVTFTSLNGQMGGWNGISFGWWSSDINNGFSSMEYSIVENGLNWNIGCNDCKQYPIITNSIIRNSAGNGIYVYGFDMLVKNTQIVNNTQNGVHIVDGGIKFGNTDSTGCDFYGNGGYNIYNNGFNAIDASYSYWGAIDSLSIYPTNYYSTTNPVTVFPNMDFPQAAYDTVEYNGILKYGAGLFNTSPVATLYMETGSDTLSANPNAAGIYSFPAVPQAGYKFGFDFNQGANWGGVNATDALLILKHFAQIQMLPEAWVTAADVNKSISINGTDAMLVMQRYAGLINSFPAGDYFYYLADYNIEQNLVYNDLRFLWMGDVNGSYTFGSSKSAPMMVYDGSMNLIAGQEILVPVSITTPENISALSIAINYPSQYLEFMEAGMFDGNQNLLYQAENGLVKMAWASVQPLNMNENNELVYLKFKVLSAPAGLSIGLELSDETELADSDAQILDVVFSSPELVAPIVVGMEDSDLPGFAMGDLYPNPITSEGMLSYTLPINAQVELSVYNPVGQVVRVLDSGSRSAGTHVLRFDVSQLSQGMYYYRLQIATEQGAFSRVNKMVISR